MSYSVEIQRLHESTKIWWICDMNEEEVMRIINDMK